VLAVADGEVVFAGVAPPFFCSPLDRAVDDQLFVEILHVTPNTGLY